MPGERSTHNAGVVGSSPTPAISEVAVPQQLGEFGHARRYNRGSQNGSQLFAVGCQGPQLEARLWVRESAR